MGKFRRCIMTRFLFLLDVHVILNVMRSMKNIIIHFQFGYTLQIPQNYGFWFCKSCQGSHMDSVWHP